MGIVLTTLSSVLCKHLLVNIALGQCNLRFQVVRWIGLENIEKRLAHTVQQMAEKLTTNMFIHFINQADFVK